MNGYRVQIHCTIYHNSMFQNNQVRSQIIHAANEKAARKQIRLKLGSEMRVDDNLTITATDEVIDFIDLLGPVQKHTTITYTYGEKQ